MPDVQVKDGEIGRSTYGGYEIVVSREKGELLAHVYQKGTVKAMHRGPYAMQDAFKWVERQKA